MPPRSNMVSAADLGYEPHHPYAAAMMLHAPEVKSAPPEKKNINKLHLPENSPRNQRRRRPNKRGNTVNFCEDTILHEVEHMDDLPGEDIWYSREEYDEIKVRNSNIVKLIKAGEFEENDEYSCRGLEHKLKEVFRQRRANKFNALNAVLEEQDRQLNRGTVDQHLISAAYQTVSVRCQESANTIAFRDYRFSLNYDPNKPVSGKAKPTAVAGETNHSIVSPSHHAKGDKKKKKKDKKDKEKKDKMKEKDKPKHNKHSVSTGEEDEILEYEAELSPTTKKKGGVRRMAKGARRMMRRMSM